MEKQQKLIIDSENIDEFKKYKVLLNCIELHCYNNQLTTLLNLPNIQILYCRYNNLITNFTEKQAIEFTIKKREFKEKYNLINSLFIKDINNKILQLYWKSEIELILNY